MNSDTKTQVLCATCMFIFFFSILLLQPVLAEPPSWPPEKPIPRIETGMHTAPIWRLSIDAQERFLVTASKDKTARVWDLAGGELKLLKILRVPLGEHPFEGQLFSVAISPDGKDVAAAGYTGKKVPFGEEGNFNIFIFDRASGQLTHTISDLPIDISQLTFSRDGRYLAVSLMGSWGLRVYRSSNWEEVYKDSDYGTGNDCYWVEFGPENILVTTAWKDGLRLYKPSGKGFERIGAPKEIEAGDQPMVARFSPDGSLLAVGFKDSQPRVMVYEVQSLFENKPLESPYAVNTKGLTEGHLARVAWSRDGNRLYAGGGFSEGGNHPILCWTEKGRGPATRLPAATNSIMDIWPLKDGRVVFGAFDATFGILAPGGQQLHVNVPDIPDFQDRQKQFRLSHDGGMVEFAFGMQETNLTKENYRARLDIKARKLTLNPPSGPGEGQELRPPNTTGFKDSDWNDTKSPRFHNRRLSIGGEEVSHCLTRIPGGRGFIMGTNWHLRFYDENGAPRGTPIELPSTAYAVNVSGDGQVAVAALGDGSLHWYQLKDRKEIFAFFHYRDGRWVMWSPKGFFTCSPDGGKLLVYYLNQGLEKTPQFVTADQLFDQFYREDLVADLVAWHLAAPKSEMPKEVQTALQKGSVHQVLNKGLPPTVEIIGPREVHHQGEDFTLQLKITDHGGGIGKIIYQVNGITLEPRKTRELNPFSTSGWQEANIRGVEAQWPLILAPGEKNIITVVVKNSNGVESMPAILTVYCDEPKTADLPTLYGLVVGISSYSHLQPPLEYPAKDALDLKAAIEKCGHGLFKEIKIKKLVDQEVTLKAINDAFQELAPQVKPDDAFLLFLAGHGKNLKGCYYFLPDNLRTASDDALSHDGLDQEKLQALLAQIPVKRSLILLDTCYSGTFALLPPPEGQKNALDHVNRRLGRRAILSSASDQQVALEGYKGHGLFTYALLEALKRPDADLNGDGKIDIQELFIAVKTIVTRIAREKWRIKQEPMSSDLRFVDFKIAKVNPNQPNP